MARHRVRPLKFEREIDHHRRLHQHLELSRVTDNWIFYWRFLAHLQDREYRPRTVERYHEKRRSFLRWLDGRPLRRVGRDDVERYLLYRKAQRQRVGLHDPLHAGDAGGVLSVADAILSHQREPRGRAAHPAVLSTAGAAGSVQPRRDAASGAGAGACRRTAAACCVSDQAYVAIFSVVRRVQRIPVMGSPATSCCKAASMAAITSGRACAGHPGCRREAGCPTPR